MISQTIKQTIIYEEKEEGVEGRASKTLLSVKMWIESIVWKSGKYVIISVQMVAESFQKLYLV